MEGVTCQNYMFGYVICPPPSNQWPFPRCSHSSSKESRPENPHFPQGILRGGHLFTAPELCLSSFMALTLEANFSSISRRIWRPESGPLLAAKASSSWWVFHQPVLKHMRTSNWIISPGIGLKIKSCLSCHLLVLVRTSSPKQQEEKGTFPQKKSLQSISSDRKKIDDEINHPKMTLNIWIQVNLVGRNFR